MNAPDETLWNVRPRLKRQDEPGAPERWILYWNIQVPGAPRPTGFCVGVPPERVKDVERLLPLLATMQVFK